MVLSELGLKLSDPQFHRKANPRTQTIRIAVKQNTSCEIWGRGAFGGLPAALAWHGELPDSEEGTQFTTDIPHFKNGDPKWAYWYAGQPGVRETLHKGRTLACVAIEPLLNRYRCK